MECGKSIKGAKSFFLGTLFSRITGVFRDIALSFFFGSSNEIATFMVAFRFTYLFRKLFGESTIQSGFIPYYSNLEKERAFPFYRDFSFSLFFFLLLAVGFLELGCWAFHLIYPLHFFHYMMLIFPGLVFIFVDALSSSFLHCQNRFFLSGLSPLFFNIIWVAATFFLKNHSKIGYGLSVATVAAFFIQWSVVELFCMKIYVPYLSKSFFSFKLFSKEVRSLLKPLFLTAMGVGALQINAFLDAFFSKIVDPSGPAFLWYSIRFYQLPLALFVISFSNALLPQLSKANDRFHFQNILEKCLKNCLSLIFLSFFALMTLAGPVLNFIYGRGHFTALDTLETVRCLWSYSLGLIPAAFVILLSTVFYAKKNYKIPMFGSWISVIANLIFNCCFVFIFQLSSFAIALATGLSSLMNALYLFSALKKYQISFSKNAKVSFLKNGLSWAAAGTATIFLALFLKEGSVSYLFYNKPLFERAFWKQTSILLTLGIFYLSIGFIGAKLLGCTEIFAFLKPKKTGFKDKAGISD